jgi:regulator of protease activity HflC (stomatin/prohibitin superfamily)
MSRYWNDKDDSPAVWPILRDIGLATIAVVAAGMYGCPLYNVYQQSLSGKAALGRAMQDRQIAVQEAQAKMEAASLLAQAEIARAKGVAGANAIIAESLKGNESYLRYLWITEVAAVGKEGKTVVYVPTEANLPILEAARKP